MPSSGFKVKKYRVRFYLPGTPHLAAQTVKAIKAEYAVEAVAKEWGVDEDEVYDVAQVD